MTLMCSQDWKLLCCISCVYGMPLTLKLLFVLLTNLLESSPWWFFNFSTPWSIMILIFLYNNKSMSWVSDQLDVHLTQHTTTHLISESLLRRTQCMTSFVFLLRITVTNHSTVGFISGPRFGPECLTLVSSLSIIFHQVYIHMYS